MKNKTKTIASVMSLTLLCVILLLSGCKQEEYKKDIDAKELASELSQKTPTESACTVWRQIRALSLRKLCPLSR